MGNFNLKLWLERIIFISIFCFVTPFAFAAGKLPFVSTMTVLQENFLEFLLAASAILMMATFLMLAFGEWSAGVQKLINVTFWLALAFAVPTVIAILFSKS